MGEVEQRRGGAVAEFGIFAVVECFGTGVSRNIGKQYNVRLYITNMLEASFAKASDARDSGAGGTRGEFVYDY